MTAVTVRAARAADIPAVAALETLCFSRPWREKDFADMLTDPARTLLVAEADGVFSGYIAACTVLDETDITTVGGTVCLEVRRSNAPARALYAALGFAECGIRKNYYESPREDAVLCRHDAAAESG